MKYPPITTKFKRKTTSPKVLVKKTEILDFIAQYGRHPSVHSDNPLEVKMAWNLKNYTNKRLIYSYDSIFHAKVNNVPTRIALHMTNGSLEILNFVKTYKRLPFWNSVGYEQDVYRMLTSRRKTNVKKKYALFFKTLAKLLDKYNIKRIGYNGSV